MIICTLFNPKAAISGWAASEYLGERENASEYTVSVRIMLFSRHCQKREARAQFFEREKTPTVINSARESSLMIQQQVFLLLEAAKRGNAARETLGSMGVTDKQANRVWKSILGEGRLPILR